MSCATNRIASKLALCACAAALCTLPTPGRAPCAEPARRVSRTARHVRLARRFARLEQRFLPLLHVANTVGGSSNFHIGAKQQAELTHLLGAGYTQSTRGGPKNNSTIVLASADGRRRVVMKHLSYSMTLEERSATGLVKVTKLRFGRAKPDVWETTPLRTMLLSALHSYTRPQQGRQLDVSLTREQLRPGVYRPDQVKRTITIGRPSKAQ